MIKTPKGLIAGFSKQNFCVQTAGTADWAKLFATKKAAGKFIALYGDAGYGMDSKTAEIISA